MRLLITLLFSLALCGLARGETFTEKNTRLHFPERIGAWHRIKVTQFPAKQLGVEIGYQAKDGAIAAFYVYNDGVTRIPTGAENAVVKKEFQNTQAELVATLKSHFDAVSKFVESAPTVTPKGKKASLVAAAYQFAEKRGRHHLTWLLLTGYRNQFLKLRYTHSFENQKADFDRGQVELKQLITGFLDQNEENKNGFWM